EDGIRDFHVTGVQTCALPISFLAYCFFYYSQMFKNAPFRFTDFESIVLKYGEGDSLINQFDSATGRYQYLNSNDSLVVDTVRFRSEERRVGKERRARRSANA